MKKVITISYEIHVDSDENVEAIEQTIQDYVEGLITEQKPNIRSHTGLYIIEVYSR